jgi:hypothetical protein
MDDLPSQISGSYARVFMYERVQMVVETAEYVDGSLAVQCVDGHEDEPYATLSVRMPGDPPPWGVFFLKDWSEGAEIAAAFVRSGLIEPVPDVAPRASGHVIAYPWRFKR